MLLLHTTEWSEVTDTRDTLGHYRFGRASFQSIPVWPRSVFHISSYCIHGTIVIAVVEAMLMSAAVMVVLVIVVAIVVVIDLIEILQVFDSNCGTSIVSKSII